jgi:hypothetical protein
VYPRGAKHHVFVDLVLVVDVDLDSDGGVDMSADGRRLARGGRPRHVAVAVKVHADDQDQVNEVVVFCTAEMRREM